MKNTYCVAMVMAMAALSAALLLAPMPGLGQAPAPATVADQTSDQAKSARARRIAETVARNARVLTVFDRQGKVVATVGEPAIYNQPSFSPDRTRLAVVKSDLESNTEDVWVLNVASGNSTRITSNQTRRQEQVRTPVWSPDGSQVAYGALRGGSWGLYRKASNGEGTEELLYQHPGADVTLTDWSPDGRFLSFTDSDISGGTLYALPLAGDGERKPIEVLRSESQLQGSTLSPDSRFLSYGSDQSGRVEVYVRPFDPLTGAGATAAAGPWQVSDQGGQGPAFWRRDTKEMYYFSADRSVMVVEVSTAPTFTFGKPKLLFRPPEGVPVPLDLVSVSRDGQRVVIAAPHAPSLQQITVFDRQGRVLRKVGEPGLHFQPTFSPDGTRLAILRIDRNTRNKDIWTFDVATGKSWAVTNDALSDDFPMWSPDGNQVLYVSTRRTYAGIYRKAWDGSGSEELLFRYTPGAPIFPYDMTSDGKFLIFRSGILLVVPLSGDLKALERQAIEWLREEYNAFGARFSPDFRFVAYRSDEIELDNATFEIHVRPFDASKPEAGAGAAKSVQVSQAGAQGMSFWRQDGKEMYYQQNDLQTDDALVFAVDVSTTPTFEAGTPRLLFRLQGVLHGSWGNGGNVSSDGQRFVFNMPVPTAGTPAR